MPNSVPPMLGRVGDAGDAARLAEAAAVLGDDAHDLAEAEGDDGEVVAAEAERRRRRAPRPPPSPPTMASGRASQAVNEPAVGRELGGGVGADREERHVAEVEQAGVAHDDVQAEGEQDVHADREEQDALPVAGRGWSGTRPRKREDGDAARATCPTSGSRSQRAADRLDDRQLGQADASFMPLALPRLSPSRPLGRNISTSTSTTKANTSFHSPAEDGRAVVLEQAEQQAADERAADVADAAEHRGGERLDAGQEADVEAGGLEEDHEEEAGGAGEDAAEQERERDDPVDVDAHELRRLGVLGGGADAPAEPAAAHELVERRP